MFFSESTAVRLEFGVDELSFDTINIQLTGGVGIKGHTYLADQGKHVYTSTVGIKEVSAGATWAAPSDYGYLANEYIYYAGDYGESIETTFLQAQTTFASDSPLDISLLVDTYQVAYYWDGQDTTRYSFVDTWHKEDSIYFPAGTPVIGITYLPLYVSVNQNLVSETYVVGANESDMTPVTGNFYDEQTTMNMTLIFDDSNNFFIGRTANWDLPSTAGFRLPQFVRTAVVTGTDYSLTLNSYDDRSGGWINTSTVAGFSRLAVGGVGTLEFTDSTGYTQPLYYKRVK